MASDVLGSDQSCHSFSCDGNRRRRRIQHRRSGLRHRLRQRRRRIRRRATRGRRRRRGRRHCRRRLLLQSVLEIPDTSGGGWRVSVRAICRKERDEIVAEVFI